MKVKNIKVGALLKPKENFKFFLYRFDGKEFLWCAREAKILPILDLLLGDAPIVYLGMVPKKEKSSGNYESRREVLVSPLGKKLLVMPESWRYIEECG